MEPQNPWLVEENSLPCMGPLSGSMLVFGNHYFCCGWHNNTTGGNRHGYESDPSTVTDKQRVWYQVPSLTGRYGHVQFFNMGLLKHPENEQRVPCFSFFTSTHDGPQQRLEGKS